MRIGRVLAAMVMAGAMALVPAHAAAAAAPAVASVGTTVAVAHVGAPARAVPGTPCSSTARACVDRATNRAWLILRGRISYGPVPITHGRAGYTTPPGRFRVSFHSRHHVSSIYRTPMPYSVFFNRGIAFHQGSLRQLSHGCIHLSRSAAREFYFSLDDGDIVQVV